MKSYSSFGDKKIECKDCQSNFIWTGGEQAFLQRLIDEGKKDKFGTPITFIASKRCPKCRAKRKAEREAREK